VILLFTILSEILENGPSASSKKKRTTPDPGTEQYKLLPAVSITLVSPTVSLMRSISQSCSSAKVDAILKAKRQLSFGNIGEGNDSEQNEKYAFPLAMVRLLIYSRSPVAKAKPADEKSARVPASETRASSKKSSLEKSETIDETTTAVVSPTRPRSRLISLRKFIFYILSTVNSRVKVMSEKARIVESMYVFILDIICVFTYGRPAIPPGKRKRYLKHFSTTWPLLST
jgi:hypothetical protein